MTLALPAERGFRSLALRCSR